MRTIARLWKAFRAWPDLYQLAAIIAVLVVLGMMVPKAAKADSIARKGSDWIRLTLKPCEGAAAEEVKKLGKDPLSFRSGYARISGADYSLCWIPADGGAAVLFDDGDTGQVPLADLKPAPEA